jgi:HTH-type transcriptional regulator, repressor for puuD
MAAEGVSPPHVLHSAEIAPFDRGSGVITIPLVGKWNTVGNQVTTGITAFAPGTGIPLHTHNVEETVLMCSSSRARRARKSATSTSTS